MKYFISICLLLVVNLKAQDCKAVLTIETDNELAFVIINEDEPVNGKIVQVELDPGTYIITIGEASDRWDARTFYDTIVVAACERINKSYYFFKEVLLDTEPQDVYVFTADTLLGHTPLMVPPDVIDILLKKEGYEDKNIKLSGVSLDQRIKLNPISIEKNGSFFESPLFLYLSGSLLVFGAVTAYYKLQADDNFQEYQLTGNQFLLDKTHRLDTISGITFSALQINFGMLLYFFLTD